MSPVAALDYSANVDVILRAMARCEDWGRPVAYVDGWEERGWPSSPPLVPRGITNHHTATGALAYDYPSLGIIRDGHAGLPYPPLANFGTGRHTGTIFVIGAGKATHAGPGGWLDLSGNSSVWGIEHENNGVGEPWSEENLLSALCLNVALCLETPIDPAYVMEHYEWSEYKIDRANCYPDDGAFRDEVARLVAGGGPGPGGITRQGGLWVALYG